MRLGETPASSVIYQSDIFDPMLTDSDEPFNQFLILSGEYDSFTNNDTTQDMGSFWNW